MKKCIIIACLMVVSCRAMEIPKGKEKTFFDVIPKDIKQEIDKFVAAHVTQPIQSSPTVREALFKVKSYFKEYAGVIAQELQKKFSKESITNALLSFASMSAVPTVSASSRIQRPRLRGLRAPLAETSYDRFSMIQILVRAGADIEGKNSDQATPLLLASGNEEGASQDPFILEQFKKIVTFLLNQHANPNVVDAKGNSPLSLAALNNNTAVVEILLQSGARTGLDQAVQASLNQSNLAMLQLLVKAGADVNAVLPSDQKVLATAYGVGNTDIINYLIEQGAKE